MGVRVGYAAVLLAFACADESPFRAGPEHPPPDWSAPAELIDPGAEPRRPLRYHFDKPFRRDIRVALASGAMAMRKSDKTAEMANVIPPVTLTLQMMARPATDECRYAYRVADLDTNPPPSNADQAALRAHLRQQIGTNGSITFDTRGNFREFSISFVPDIFHQSLLHWWMSHALPEVLQHIGVPLPEEQVGLGASWKWTEVKHRGGFEIKRNYVARLVALADEHGRIDLSVTATVRSMHNDSREIVDIASRGTGSAELDLGQAVALPMNLRESVVVHEQHGESIRSNEFVTVFFGELEATPLGQL